MKNCLILIVLPAFLALGLREYADWKSVLIMCACEYALVFAFLRHACAAIAGAKFGFGRCCAILILAELPTLSFPIMAFFGAPAYAVSQMGAISLAAGGIIAFFAVRRSGPGPRFAAAAVAASAFYISVSWALSVWIVRPPTSQAMPFRVSEERRVGKPYDPGLNSFAERPPMEVIRSEALVLEPGTTEYRALQIILSDVLCAYYNRSPLKVGYYRLAPGLLRYRAFDHGAQKWDKQNLRARFFINEIAARELPGAVEFRTRGRLRTMGASASDAADGAKDMPFDMSINIYRAAASPERRAVWTVYYIRANHIN